MTRVARLAPGGMIFHVLNRGVGRMLLFEKPEDFAAFERVLEQTLQCLPIRLLAYCLMSNHWHLLLWPERDGQLAQFMQRLTITHVRRWVEYRHDRGHGHVYQGRYKSFPVQDDQPFLTVACYVERNALRAGLVERAELWRYSSLWRRERGSTQQQSTLHPWPVDRPEDWVAWVNEPQTAAELAAVRRCVRRGSPFGQEPWVQRTVAQLGLQSTLRPRSRPPQRRGQALPS